MEEFLKELTLTTLKGYFFISGLTVIVTPILLFIFSKFKPESLKWGFVLGLAIANILGLFSPLGFVLWVIEGPVIAYLGWQWFESKKERKVEIAASGPYGPLIARSHEKGKGLRWDLPSPADTTIKEARHAFAEMENARGRTFGQLADLTREQRLLEESRQQRRLAEIRRICGLEDHES